MKMSYNDIILYAATPPLEALRLIISLAATYKNEIMTMMYHEPTFTHQ